jgi:hypothetical protein
MSDKTGSHSVGKGAERSVAPAGLQSIITKNPAPNWTDLKRTGGGALGLRRFRFEKGPLCPLPDGV